MSDLLEPGLRFLHYGVLIGLLGAIGFRPIARRLVGWVDGPRGGWALGLVALAAPLLTAVLMLVGVAAMMGLALAELDRASIEAIVLGTTIGTAFLVRFGLLVLGLAAVLLQARLPRAGLLAAVCYGGALLTLGWSGHAAAGEGAIGLAHRLNNGVHLIAAALWIGAIGWFLHLARMVHRQPDAARAQQLLHGMHRFAPLGIGLVGVVSLTGLINAELIFGLGQAGAVLDTRYGVLLAAKLALVALMLGFAAFNARAVRRGANGLTPVLAALRRSLAGELALGVGVIALVALLGTLSPAMM